MSSFITNTSSCTPFAGWLTKMISLPFGRSRWTSRYFVLLDSELRFYKDEHSDSASQILNLRKIRQAIPTPTTQHPFCFRLEPQQSSENAIRPWIIECKSQSDMETWIAAIQSRIAKYSTSIKSPCHTSSPAASLLLSPKIKSAAAPETSKSTPRIVSTCSIMNNVSPEVYRMPALPLRCTNLTSSDDDEEEEGKESLLSRRNKKLAPIITINRQQQEEIVIEEEEVAPQTSYSTSTLCSSTLPSPTGAVLGPLISPGIIDRYSQYNNKALMQSSSQPSLIISTKEALLYQQKQQQAEKEEGEQSSSPTYLMYKKRFRL